MKKLYTFSYRAAFVIALLMLFPVSVSSLFFTSYSYDMESQFVSLRTDNLLRTLLCSAALVFTAYLIIHYLSKKYPAKTVFYTELVVIASYFLIGSSLILWGRTAPAADPMSVYAAAESIAAGDYSVFAGTTSYFSYYPFQVGLALVESVFCFFWNLLPFSAAYPAYHAMKIVYVFLIMACVHLFKRVCDLLWNSTKTSLICLLLCFLNLPFVFYSSYLYGEVPSLFLYLAGFYLLLRYIKKEGTHLLAYAVLGCVLCGFSVVLRKNSLILILALVITLVFEALRTKGKELLLLAALTLLLSLLLPKGIQSYIEYRADYKLADGVTGLSYVAMGMQEGTRCAGWYNGFNFLTYQDAGLDNAKANEVAMQAIRERTAELTANPSYALDFYWRKFTSLWCDGTYSCRQATLATLGNRSEFLNQVYCGSYQSVVVDWCDIFQNFLYVGSLLYALLAFRKKDPAASHSLFEATFLICMIGGFLFHMVWEANSRYIITYAVLLIPLAARGLSVFSWKGKVPQV